MLVPFDSKEGQDALRKGFGKYITEEDAREALACMPERFKKLINKLKIQSTADNSGSNKK